MDASQDNQSIAYMTTHTRTHLTIFDNPICYGIRKATLTEVALAKVVRYNADTTTTGTNQVTIQEQSTK